MKTKKLIYYVAPCTELVAIERTQCICQSYSIEDMVENDYYFNWEETV